MSTAQAIYCRFLRKAAGDIIGHTASNKAIYSAGHVFHDGLRKLGTFHSLPVAASAKAVHATHSDYSARDHLDAAAAHYAHFNRMKPPKAGAFPEKHWHQQRVAEAHLNAAKRLAETG